MAACSCSSANMLSSASTLAHMPTTFSSSLGSFRPCPSRVSVAVTCSAKDESSKTSAEVSTKQDLSPPAVLRQQAEKPTSRSPASTVSSPIPEPKRRPDTRSLSSLLAFNGAGPETINGRMAMVGFMWALAAEKLTGLAVTEQLFNPSTAGILWFGAVVPLLTAASLIPFTKGESTDDRAWGPFSTFAERWNGRFAMIGFAALLVNEMVIAGPLIHS